MCICACVTRGTLGYHGLDLRMNHAYLHITVHPRALELALKDDKKSHAIHAKAPLVYFLVLSSFILLLNLSSSFHLIGQQIPMEHLLSQELCLALGYCCELGTFC